MKAGSLALAFFLLVMGLLLSGCETEQEAEGNGGVVDGDLTEDEIENEIPDEGLPDSLPFELTRPDEGAAPTEAEITAFTRKFTGFLKDVDFFKWVLRISHGVHESSGAPDFSVWWTGVEPTKSEGLVTFLHTTNGGPDNIMIPTSKTLAVAAAGYLLTGDEDLGRIVEQYSKGVSAMFMGMMFSEDDPDYYIMARAVMTHNYEITIEGDKRRAVDYTPWLHETTAWNSDTINVPDNPYWGDIWVKNMRSKDDVPHIFRAAAFLTYVVEYGQDEYVRDAATKAYEDLVGFAKDIVDNGYHIRTKDKNGVPYIPDQDLASFNDYDQILGERSECNPKLASALLGYGEDRGLDCGGGDGGKYEEFATRNHYFNYAIIRGFHMSAILHALIKHKDDIAHELLDGLIERADEIVHKSEEDLPGGRSMDSWLGDVAVFLVQSASAGMPLTSHEAGLIQNYFSQAIDSFSTWEYWDLWEESVPDTAEGETHPYKPGHHVGVDEIGFLIEYCYSPFKNPAGASFVDCDIIGDMDQWGAEE